MTNLNDLFAGIAKLKEQEGKIKAAKKLLTDKIDEAVNAEFDKTRSAKDKHFGALTLEVDGVKVKQTVPKKVDWDQSKLNDVAEKLAKDGENPHDTLVVKLSVSEKAYDAMTEERKVIFKDARTEKAGSIAYDIVIKK